MPAAWSAKDERMYKAIKTSCLKRDKRRTKTCPRIAAATVNKRRREEGRTLSDLELETFPELLIGAGAGATAASLYPHEISGRLTDQQALRYTENRLNHVFIAGLGLLGLGVVLKMFE